MDRGAWQAMVHGAAKVGHDRSDLTHLYKAQKSKTEMRLCFEPSHE